MNAFLPLLTTACLCASLYADGGDAADAPRQQVADGDNVVAGASVDLVTSRKWIVLNEGAKYRVMCQVFYTDYLNPAPSTADEIKQSKRLDNFLNIALREFLAECYGKLSAAELVAEYRAGRVRKNVRENFPTWLWAYVDELNKEDGETVAVTIQDVSMRAVGPFAEAVRK